MVFPAPMALPFLLPLREGILSHVDSLEKTKCRKKGLQRFRTIQQRIDISAVQACRPPFSHGLFTA